MNRNSRKKAAESLVALVILLVVLLFAGYIFLCMSTSVVIHGDRHVVLEAGEKYTDEGCHATFFGREKDLEVQCSGTVNIDVPGRYEIKYRVKGNPFTRAVKLVEVKPNCDPEESGGYFVNGLILVNKEHHVNKDYAPGENKVAKKALKKLQKAAKEEGYSIPLVDGFRSYETQEQLYRLWVELEGEEYAGTYSAEPGHSEHQTGLAFDVGLADPVFAGWPEGKWLAENAHKFGFIIRYPEGKENITRYAYEPWHVRYVGKSIAREIYEKGLTLEEYLGEA